MTPAGRPGEGLVLPRLLAIEDALFTGERLRVYGIGLVAGLAIAAVICWTRDIGAWVVRPDGRLGNIDFCWIWVSGKFAAMAHPSWIYRQAIYAAAQNIYYRPGECLFLHQYVYPPTFLFLTYPLGLLPYLAAYGVWVGVTLAIYLTAIYAILPRKAALAAAVIPAFALKNFQLGHNGFLTAALVGLSLVVIERRPWLAGISLGLLICKPHFAVLFPLVLIASRNWRALGGAAAATALLGIAAAIAFGRETWLAFFASLFDRNVGLSPQTGVVLLLESVYGLLQWVGASARLAAGVHLAVAAAAAIMVSAVWARPYPPDLKAALLPAASLLFSPYVLLYDFCILSIAIAFFVKDGLVRGFLAGERAVLLLAVLLLDVVPIPLGSVSCVIVVLLISRRIAAAGGLPATRVNGLAVGG